MTEFWERYGFYISQALIALLLIHVFKFSERHSFELTGTFVGLVYTISIVGGYIADKFIGHFRATVLGETFLIVGFLLLGYSVATEILSSLYLSLAIISVGTGLVKSNISSFLGHFYTNHDPKRDMGFSIFYVGINLVGLIGGFLAGYLNRYFGWSLAFYTASAGAFIGLLTVVYGIKKYQLDFEKN